MTITVYRIEHKETGLGPYAERSRYLDHLNCDFLYRNSPAPYEDGLGYDWVCSVPDGRFGFATVNQLRRWFCAPNALALLEANGFILALYRAREYEHGDSQVVFAPATAERIEARPPTSAALLDDDVLCDA